MTKPEHCYTCAAESPKGGDGGNVVLGSDKEAESKRQMPLVPSGYDQNRDRYPDSLPGNLTIRTGTGGPGGGKPGNFDFADDASVPAITIDSDGDVRLASGVDLAAATRIFWARIAMLREINCTTHHEPVVQENQGYRLVILGGPEPMPRKFPGNIIFEFGLSDDMPKREVFRITPEGKFVLAPGTWTDAARAFWMAVEEAGRIMGKDNQ